MLTIKKLVFWTLMMGILFSVGANAQVTPSATSLSGTFTSTGASTQIAAKLTSNTRHLVQLQACATNTQNVYLCFGSLNTCSAANAAYELAPGKMAPPLTVGMYTGINGQQLAGSLMFNLDIAFIPVSGTQCVHALLD